MSWQFTIALVALVFSVICFILFVRDATKKPDPELVDRAARKSAALVDPAALAAFAKTFAEALSKVGPGLVALIGAILFLLLAGEAAKVYQLTGGSTNSSAGRTSNSVSNNASGNASGNAATQNDSVNSAGNAH